jgi:hypothetical protein
MTGSRINFMTTPFTFFYYLFSGSHLMFPLAYRRRFAGDIGGSLPVLEHVASQSGAERG